MNIKWGWWIEWISTLLLLLGVTLTALNIFPINLWVSLAANLGWLCVGLIWHKWSLIIVQLVVSTIYILGLSKVFII